MASENLDPTCINPFLHTLQKALNSVDSQLEVVYHYEIFDPDAESKSYFYYIRDPKNPEGFKSINLFSEMGYVCIEIPPESHLAGAGALQNALTDIIDFPFQNLRGLRPKPECAYIGFSLYDIANDPYFMAKQAALRDIDISAFESLKGFSTQPDVVLSVAFEDAIAKLLGGTDLSP